LRKIPGTLQLQISSLDYSSYTGRIAVGKIHRGSIKMGDQVSIVQRNGLHHKSTVKELYTFEGLGKEKTKERVEVRGDRGRPGTGGFSTSGIPSPIMRIPRAMPPISIDEPSMSMLFTINNSPFFGKEGKFVTSSHLRERLIKETEKNLALRVEDTDSPERLMVYGRGILHLSILIETMRGKAMSFSSVNPRWSSRK
jgi:GTP-binding protein